MAFTEDLDAFLSTDDFGIAATYDAAAANTTVNVIHDAAYLEQLGIAGTRPAAMGKALDFPAASAVGKTLTIGAVTYTIKGREPLDDGAFVVLTLKA